MELFRYTDDTARQPCPGRTGRLCFKVIFLLMDHDASTDDRIRSGERDQGIDNIEMRFAVFVCFDVSKVSGVALLADR